MPLNLLHLQGSNDILSYIAHPQCFPNSFEALPTGLLVICRRHV